MISKWCRKAKPTVGVAILDKLGPELCEKGGMSQGAAFLQRFCFKYLPSQNSLKDAV